MATKITNVISALFSGCRRLMLQQHPLCVPFCASVAGNIEHPKVNLRSSTLPEGSFLPQRINWSHVQRTKLWLQGTLGSMLCQHVGKVCLRLIACCINPTITESHFLFAALPCSSSCGKSSGQLRQIFSTHRGKNIRLLTQKRNNQSVRRLCRNDFRA